MKITVIGCDGAFAKEDGATSSYLIEDNNIKILLDCGSASLSKLQKHIKLHELDIVFISHFHRDHFADLECLQVAVGMDFDNNTRTKKLDIYGPGNVDILNYKEYCNGYIYDENSEFEFNGLKLTFIKTQHNGVCYGVRITDSNDKTLVYTADTGMNDTLPNFVNNSDLLIIDSSFYEIETNKSKNHLSSSQIGLLAKENNVSKVVLTHLPHYGNNEDLVTEVKKYYDGDVELAKIHKTYKL